MIKNSLWTSARRRVTYGQKSQATGKSILTFEPRSSFCNAPSARAWLASLPGSCSWECGQTLIPLLWMSTANKIVKN